MESIVQYRLSSGYVKIADESVGHFFTCIAERFLPSTVDFKLSAISPVLTCTDDQRRATMQSTSDVPILQSGCVCQTTTIFIPV